ncbi:NADH-ubiquinone oxidoreductase complex I, 21 kDa subunit-domain-containing protein [Cokeromyces recurvatus]|uniref:NADH-ubiquinone oxidoreductase complex I, 21 kDa subunit-domain-containing protein n=1 Tax=Cokeromyces recurvatus TaxID=90255 RepID=UPI00221FCB66|nr:NADH-ubiquinone oxidoreductase complex I, 21 kDa subunit-domain-containing protein [Cokeromyces recurvatus]KAI7906178.1 NADH-ubiquinone oxidoreductase complex I, 21 kDa subunit-domain-containing protein [Cokeromyces recurvatus]
MPIKEFNTPYPVIDTDPHFTRVVRYMRPSDYAAWAAGTAAAPLLFLGMEKMDPSGYARKMRLPLKITTLIGAVGGFLFAYQNSSFRFWGWSENSKEVLKDQEEMSQRLKEGKALYGDSYMPEHIQDTSARNSRFSQLKFSAYPWFNFVKHNNHGVDTSKYSESS